MSSPAQLVNPSLEDSLGLPFGSFVAVEMPGVVTEPFPREQGWKSAAPNGIPGASSRPLLCWGKLWAELGLCFMGFSWSSRAGAGLALLASVTLAIG